jgi:hypothetical protein
MKRLMIVAVVLVSSLSTTVIAADVGVSVSIGQPGFYGRLDIGGYPQPQVIYRQPRVIERSYVEREPIYLRVPPGHAKNWKKHCGKYNACDERVYFVQDNWYNREYAPRYRDQHRGDGNDRRDNNRGNQGNDKNRGRNK